MNVAAKLHQFNKMVKDVHPNKTEEGTYFHGHNIRFVSSDNIVSGGFHFEKGNKLTFTIPSPKINYMTNSIEYTSYNYDYNERVNNYEDLHTDYSVNGVEPDPLKNSPRCELERQYYIENSTVQSVNYRTSGPQIPIGNVPCKHGIILITTDNNGFDCVWLLSIDNLQYQVKLLYMRDMGLHHDYPVEIINNYENEKVDKIYWVDTVHQMRHLNMEQSILNGDSTELMDMSVDLIEAVSAAELFQPEIKEINYGGTHTAGMIQYCYNLYKMNGSQTYASPITDLIPLGKGIGSGGGEVNEMVGTVPVIKIDNIDTTYDNIQVFAIKYTSYLTEPQVSIIEDRPIPISGSIEIYDDGSIIRNSSIVEFKMINNSLNFPSAFASKDNSLFQANYKEKNFDVDIDTRIYQFPKQSTSVLVYDNIKKVGNNITGESRRITNEYTDTKDDFDSINLDYDTNRYRYNSTKIGGDGKYFYFEIKKLDSNKEGRSKYFKSNEIYRLGVIFYNCFGQQSLPSWFCDFKAPKGNIKGFFNSLEVGLKQSFIDRIESSELDIYNKPVGYKVVVARRTNADKTVLSSGLITSMMITNNIDVDDSANIVLNGKRVGLDSTKYEALDSKLRTLTKNPSPLFRNSWLDYTKIDNEILLPTNANRTPHTTMIDAPLQKTSHYRSLSSVLAGGFLGKGPVYLAEFPRSFRKENYYFNFQDTKTMQMYCPEAVFDTLPTMPEKCKLEVQYAFVNSENNTWERLVDLTTNYVDGEYKLKNRLSACVPYVLNNNSSVDYTLGGPGRYNQAYGEAGNSWWLMTETQSRPSGWSAGTSVAIAGWSTKGLFSNYCLNKVNDSDKFTNVSLYYRKYGDNLERISSNIIVSSESPILISNIGFEPIVNIPPYLMESLLPGNISSISIGNVRATIPTAESVRLISNIRFNLNSTDDGIVTVTSGQTTSNIETFKLQADRLTSETVTSTSIYNVSTLNANSRYMSGISVERYTGINEILGSIERELLIEVLNPAGTVLDSFTHISTPSIRIDSVRDIDMIGSTTFNIIDPGQNATLSYPIYKRPLYTKKGAGATDYNGDGYFKFNNSLKNVGSNDVGGSADTVIRSINSEQTDCVTFVLNTETENDNKLATALEQVVKDCNFTVSNFNRNLGSLYCDIVKHNDDIYFSGIYGGNSHEDKKRTNYIEIGSFKPIDITPNKIVSPGDTFVQDFRFMRIYRGSVNNLTSNMLEHEEIVEYLTETTVDLYNRSDDSISNWDSSFSYKEEDYHNYNRVYSQPNIITSTRDLDYNFKQTSNFNNTVRGSKKKTNGEVIDSWLQPLVNDSMSLDGKYGPINRLLNLSDNIVALQDTGISLLSINPRVQITDPTGIELNLGTGKLLDNYKYIATGTGSMRWSCISTPIGIFYVDTRQNSINHITDNITDLTRVNGMKNFAIDRIHYDWFLLDNPVKGLGISLGYDPIRTDVYFTFLNDDNAETLVYNFSQQAFSSFYDYNSPMYISFRNHLLTIDINDRKNIYESFKGPVGRFYGNVKESSIEFISNPEPFIECEFNNLEYKDESSFNGEETIETFNEIRAQNEFQDSDIVELKPKFNLRKLNRKWRVNIPRANKVHRMRNTWLKIKLKSNNENHYEHRIDDIAVFYRPNSKKFN